MKAIAQIGLFLIASCGAFGGRGATVSITSNAKINDEVVYTNIPGGQQYAVYRDAEFEDEHDLYLITVREGYQATLVIKYTSCDAYPSDGTLLIDNASTESRLSELKVNGDFSTTRTESFSVDLHSHAVYCETGYTSRAYYTLSVVFTKLLPNLSIADMSAGASTEIRHGTDFDLTFAVVNSGKVPSAAMTARLYCDGKAVASYAVLPIGAGGKAYYARTFSGLGVGTHTLKAVADSEGVIEETNEGDNVKLLEVRVYESTPYVVAFDANGGSGVMSKQSFVYGESGCLTSNRFVKADWSFVGWATTPQGDVKYADGEEVENLASTAGQEVRLYAVWRVLPDLVPSGFRILDNVTTNGFAIKVSGSVYNAGLVEAPASTLCLYRDGTPVAFSEISTLPAKGRTQEMLFELKCPDPGNVKFSVMVNHDGLVSESNCANNCTDVGVVKVLPTRYTVHFRDQVSDKEEMRPLECLYGEEFYLPSNGFSRTDSIFVGWAIGSPDGVPAIPDGKRVKNLTASVDGSVVLYAKWGVPADSDALDEGSLTFFTSHDFPWSARDSEYRYTYYSYSGGRRIPNSIWFYPWRGTMMQAGYTSEAGECSWICTRVRGNRALLSFDWETFLSGNYASLRMYVDGVRIASLANYKEDWTRVCKELERGDRLVCLQYETTKKKYAEDYGEVNAWIDAFAITPYESVLGSAGGRRELSCPWNCLWAAKTDSSWIELDKELGGSRRHLPGGENQLIGFTVQENVSGQDRVGVIEITNRDTLEKIRLSVRQDKFDSYAITFTLGLDSDVVCRESVCVNEVWKIPSANSLNLSPRNRFAGWRCSNGRRYDDGMLVFNLANPGETVTMTAIWE